jgi:hypothetical protein
VVQAADFMAACVLYGAAFKIGLATISKCDETPHIESALIVYAMSPPQNYGDTAGIARRKNNKTAEISPPFQVASWKI